MLRLISADLKKDKIETLAVPVCEDKNIHSDASVAAIIRKAKRLKEFNGKKDQTITLYDLPETTAHRVVLRGLGKAAELDAETLRAFAGKAVKDCIQKDLTALWLAAPDKCPAKTPLSSIVTAMMEGACLGNHRFDRYRRKKEKKPLKSMVFVTTPPTVRKLKSTVSRVSKICQGTTLARDWISMPSNDKTPEQLTRMIVQQAKKQGLKTRVLQEKQLQQEKFGALLAVAAGSRSKPSLVILEHRVAGAKKSVALVGKGVTFDSGGLNIKTGGSMADMKSDMSGAAAVAATLVTAARLKTKVNLTGMIPIVENMPSGTAIRPGDIVYSYAGKSIEIGNTDAEGRLILIDAMAYAIKKFRPQLLIDLATLTGACVVALGEKIAGVFSHDDKLAAAITAAGMTTHERCWPMPLPEDYKELLKSDFADLNNISSTRWGGAVTAALFLSEFVGDTRWAHIDIAGPAYGKKESAYCGPGGTGFGVRLLTELLEKI